MKRAPKDPDPVKRWLAFLRNHREAIAAMDFFPVPTINFGVLYCFFVIAHDRRRVLHFNVTKHRLACGPFSSYVKRFPQRNELRSRLTRARRFAARSARTDVQLRKISHICR